MKQVIIDELEKHYDEMVEIRRYLHQNPELSFQEVKTATYIQEFYRRIGVETRTKVGGNGIIARIKGGKPGKTVALRADFDALPIHEETGLSFSSNVPGVMHACGHDGHTATLLMVGKVLNQLREDLEGEYVLIHQHAEELAPGGAIAMIKDGCLDGVDAVFGTHLWAEIPYGTIGYRTGPFMAAADRFQIVIKGRGGHGAMPHKTRDAVAIGSQLVMNLQQIVSRRVSPIDPAVVTVSSFLADNAFNIIADKATLQGTVRTFNEDTRNFIEQEMKKVIEGTCTAGSCEYDFEYFRGYPAVVNRKKETEFLAAIASEVHGVEKSEEIEMNMAGEDFSYYLQYVPGTYFFTGAMPDSADKAFPHHHPKFDINEKAMLLAAKTLALAATQYKEE